MEWRTRQAYLKVQHRASTAFSCASQAAYGESVAVSPSHPLWGLNGCVIVARPHGYVEDYETCALYEPEETRLPRGTHRKAGLMSRTTSTTCCDAWWFGCSADKPGDVPHSEPILAREHGETYRDIDYMYEVAVDLAGQLRLSKANFAIRARSRSSRCSAGPSGNVRRTDHG